MKPKDDQTQTLKTRFNEMHKKGPESWFSDGVEERFTIFQMGMPYKNKRVMEIGCGEGHLAAMIAAGGSYAVIGLDYSNEAIVKANRDYHHEALEFVCTGYDQYRMLQNDILVMQGVLEHLEDPWGELEWMIENLLSGGGSIITSSPCFLNPRGIVWMTMKYIYGAVMSLTDLHELHPWEFGHFAQEHKLDLQWTTCDHDWGHGQAMIEDYKDRLPKAVDDGPGIIGPMSSAWVPQYDKFLEWLDIFQREWEGKSLGATAVYKLTKQPT